LILARDDYGGDGQEIEVELRQLMEYEDLPPERAEAKNQFEQTKRD
jgi:hypothetical protein